MTFHTEILADGIVCILGDCLEVLPTLGRFDACLSDLPFGTTQNSWDSVIPLEQLWPLIWARIPDGAVVLNAAQPFTSVLITSQLQHFKYAWIWQKSRPTGFLNAKLQPLREHEEVCVFYRRQPTYNPQFGVGRPNHVSGKPRLKSHSGNYGAQYEITEEATDRKYPKTVLPITVVSPTDVIHPTQKPVALSEYMARTYTDAGDTILDVTMGSGTTGVACAALGRSFVGIEKDPEYFDAACRRIEAAIKSPKPAHQLSILDVEPAA